MVSLQPIFGFDENTEASQKEQAHLIGVCHLWGLKIYLPAKPNLSSDLFPSSRVVPFAFM